MNNFQNIFRSLWARNLSDRARFCLQIPPPPPPGTTIYNLNITSKIALLHARTLLMVLFWHKIKCTHLPLFKETVTLLMRYLKLLHQLFKIPYSLLHMNTCWQPLATWESIKGWWCFGQLPSAADKHLWWDLDLYLLCINQCFICDYYPMMWECQNSGRVRKLYCLLYISNSTLLNFFFKICLKLKIYMLINFYACTSLKLHKFKRQLDSQMLATHRGIPVEKTTRAIS